MLVKGEFKRLVEGGFSKEKTKYRGLFEVVSKLKGLFVIILPNSLHYLG